MQNNKINKNVILAVVFSLAFMFLWQYFYEAPKQQKAKQIQAESLNKTGTQEKQEEKSPVQVASSSSGSIVPTTLALAKTAGERVFFENSKVKGSINSVGLKIDNLELRGYEANKGAKVVLLAPEQTKEAYFVQFGFSTNTEGLTMPNSKTVWNVARNGENNFIAKWQNPQGLTFEVTLKLDENYMFSVSQKVINNSGKEVLIAPFTRILRAEPLVKEATMISHEGFVGSLSGVFDEFKYDKIKETKRLFYPNQKETFWAGFSDKYWLTSFFYNNQACFGACSFVPADVSINYFKEGGIDRYQVDFVTEELSLQAGQTLAVPSKFFAGAKELKLLDKYEAQGFEVDGKIYPFQHFDKTVDFGIFYFLTKPIFLLLTFLNSFLHNFGFAIILLTVIVKLILFPIATKGYLSMGKMKAVAPLVEDIRKNAKDKMEQNRKIMELYRAKKINPLSGCLPILLQIPVFFALYKVLYISIEMRDAPFIWWITDLSMKDPTSMFNLFGLLPFAVPSFLQIGVLPILMGLTTYLQQSLSPNNGDPTQAMILKTMPFVLVFVFATFPAGIVLYWIANNILSILQQLFVEKVMLPKAVEKGGLNVKEKR